MLSSLLNRDIAQLSLLEMQLAEPKEAMTAVCPTVCGRAHFKLVI